MGLRECLGTRSFFGWRHLPRPFLRASGSTRTMSHIVLPFFCFWIEASKVGHQRQQGAPNTTFRFVISGQIIIKVDNHTCLLFRLFKGPPNKNKGPFSHPIHCFHDFRQCNYTSSTPYSSFLLSFFASSPSHPVVSPAVPGAAPRAAPPRPAPSRRPSRPQGAGRATRGVRGRRPRWRSVGGEEITGGFVVLGMLSDPGSI